MTHRPRIAIVTRSWGGEDDAAAITRLVAGAFAIHGEVDVVYMTEDPTEGARHDSVFLVHDAPLEGAHPVRAAVARAAIAMGSGATVPASLLALLDEWEGCAPSVPKVLDEIAPDVVVFMGSSQPFDLATVGGLGARIVFVPLAAPALTVHSTRFADLVQISDVVASIHPDEDHALSTAFGATTVVTPLDVALPLNRSATDQSLFGVGWFGPYVVAVRSFPADAPRYARSITHDVLRGALGEIAVAEIDGTRWRISDAENTAELPVNPTRVNLWRLMKHGMMTVDLRPPDILGREALESMMLGTPAVVPDDSAAKAHVERANGGVWYRNVGEALDASRALLDETVRSALGAQGEQYAVAHHGDMDAFVARVGALAGFTTEVQRR
jgi:hypothetical protein